MRILFAWPLRLLVVLTLIGVIGLSQRVEAGGQLKDKAATSGVIVQIDKLVLPALAIEGGEFRLVNESVPSPEFPRTVTESGKLNRTISPLNVRITANNLSLLRTAFPEFNGGAPTSHTVIVYELSNSGQGLTATTYESCTLSELMLGGLTASGATSLSVDLVFAPTKFSRKASPAVPSPAAPKIQTIRSNGFQVEIPGMDARGVTAISPIRIQFPNRVLRQTRAVADCGFSVQTAFSGIWISWFDQGDAKPQCNINLLEFTGNRAFRVVLTQVFPVEHKKSIRSGQGTDAVFATAIRDVKFEF